MVHPALHALARAAVNPRLVSPHLRARHGLRSVTEQHWKALSEAGIKGVVLDRDNTLSVGGVGETFFDAAVARSVSAAVAVFGPGRVMVFSNAACNASRIPLHRTAADAFAKALTPLHIVTDADFDGVPRAFREDVDFRKPGDAAGRLLMHVAEAQSVHICELCMVGDRLLTDVLFANLFGMVTLWTEPLVREKTAAMRAMLALERPLVYLNGPTHNLVTPALRLRFEDIEMKRKK